MATYYFRNITASWNTASNWSLTSGGGATGSVPTNADTAIFDGNSATTCDVDTTAVCLNLTITRTTVSQVFNNNSISINGNQTISSTTGNVSGTTVINFNGTSTQTVTSDMTSGRWSNNITFNHIGTVNFQTGLKYSGIMTHYTGIVTGLLDIDYPPVRSSVRFDGINEYVNIDSVLTPLAATTVGTWSAWVNPHASGARSVISFFRTTGANSGITLNINRISCNEAGVSKWILNYTLLVIGQWSYVTLVQDGVSPVIYVNGALPTQSFSVTTDKTEWFNSVVGIDNGRIGEVLYSGGEIYVFSGQIGMVKLWNTNLSAAEVLADYNLGQAIYPISNTPQYANLVAAYNMGLGDTYPTLIDSVGGYNGTMVNMETDDIFMIDRTTAGTFS